MKGDSDKKGRKTTASTKPEPVMAATRPRFDQLQFVVFFLVSCGIGLYNFSPKLFGGHAFVESSRVLSVDHETVITTTTASAPTSTPHGVQNACEVRFRSMFPMIDDHEYSSEKSDSVPFVVHRNGEATPCGEVTIGAFVNHFKEYYYDVEGCPDQLDKYQFEALLTKSLNGVLANACHSIEDYGDESWGLLGYCDMGEDHTPILTDHQSLVPVESESESGQSYSSLPCHFHTREGQRITQSPQLSDFFMAALQGNDDEHDCEGDEATETCIASTTTKAVHLYSVPAGRVFMFAPSYVGEIFDLPHVPGSSDKSIYLEVLSLRPRVFDVFNFFNREESEELVDKANNEKSETHRIKRSTTGASDKAVNSKRTSESGFDTSGKTAMKIKRRCFDALGFDEYIESHSDGLQILRYNVSKAYNSHLDWIEDPSGQLKHDYESGGTGGNRFATILLYMSDLGETDGGETVFPYGIPSNIPEEKRITKDEARAQLRSSEEGSVLVSGSWQEDLVATCRSQLAVRPHSSRAVLFYSQHPNGDVDKASLHGACPVLSNQKYAANLWVWNTPRTGFPGAPIKKKFQGESGSPVVTDTNINLKINGRFKNSGKDPIMDNAGLFYEDQFWGKFGKGDTLSVNTFEGHVWNVKVDGKIVKTWVVLAKDGENQHFII